MFSAGTTGYFPVNYGQQHGYNSNFPGGPIRSLVNSVQPPSVSTPTVDDPESIYPQRLDYGFGSVMQGRWVSREQFGDPAITKKYSIAQLMDILIGESVPSDSDLTRTMFQPGQEMNSSTFHSQAPAAGVAQGFTTGPPNLTTSGGSSTSMRIPYAPVTQSFVHCPTNPAISGTLIQLPQGTAAQSLPIIANNSLNPNIVRRRLFDTERISSTTSVTDSNEQSAYFGQQQPLPVQSMNQQSEAVTGTRKSVSFMTDSNNNISVERIMYDLFSQDQSGLENVMSPNSTEADFQSFCELFNSIPSASDNAATLNSTLANPSSNVSDSQCPLFDYNNNLTAIQNQAGIGATTHSMPSFPVNFEFGTGANISIEAPGAQKTLSQHVRDVFALENLTTTEETVNNTLSTGNYHSSRPVLNDVVVSTSSTPPQEDDGYTTSEFF
ncbi:unnamed protein product [Orchesella dallaii]|uniref:Uncharacterized protein n=1 Tax=Orchesella dallaii TaxID=48710 RepID=A0ABP1RZN2_9HEXA